MKFVFRWLFRYDPGVAPLAGAWIEMVFLAEYGIKILVAPLAGAWIEMDTRDNSEPPIKVAPLAGAWIEIRQYPRHRIRRHRRTPRGCVD